MTASFSEKILWHCRYILKYEGKKSSASVKGSWQSPLYDKNISVGSNTYIDVTKHNLIRIDLFHCISGIGNSCPKYFICSCSIYHYLLIKM